MLRLHYHPVSSYSRKVLVAMLHRGDRFERAVLDVFGGALGSPAYLALSPFGKMPALETDEGSLFESTSIVEWLEARGPRVLIPSGEELVARRYDRLGDLYLMDAQADYWFRPHTDAGKAAPATMEKAWGIFVERLAGRDFVCDAGFSLGDIGAAIATDYAEAMGLTPPRPVREWRARCFEIPAMAEAMEEARPTIRAMLAQREARMAERAAR